MPGEDFRLFFDTGDEERRGQRRELSPARPNEDGYFLLLASPEVKAEDEKPVPKTVVFVVDRSGSMSGEKIEQAKDAAKFVLNNLREGDLFNIVAYDSEITTFRPELEKFNDETRAAAIGFVDGLYAGGSTDIDGALKRALGMLQDNKRPTYVLFLTDGLPTAGETGEAAIVKHSEEGNDVRARVFAFGVGYDVNSRLLDKLARANFGLSQYVRPNEDIEASVSALYRKIGAPVMTDVTVTFDVEGAKPTAPQPVNRVYPKGEFDLFAGDQVVLVGRYTASGKAKVKLTGKIGDEERVVRLSRRPRRKERRRHERVRRQALGDAARRRHHRRARPQRPQRRAGEGARRARDRARHPHAVHVVPGRRNERRAAAYRESLAAMRGVEALDQSSGRFGFAQRESKLALQSASQAPAAASSGPARAGASGGFGGGGGYFGGNVRYYDALNDKQEVAANCRQIGRKTFFQRGDKLVDSSVSAEQEKSAKKVKRYSREYFDLVEKHGKHVAQYLALDEPVVINLGSETYTW